jgi:hypothetical protein
MLKISIYSNYFKIVDLIDDRMDFILRKTISLGKTKVHHDFLTFIINNSPIKKDNYKDIYYLLLKESIIREC